MSTDLHCDGRRVARYVWEPSLPATVSPRPYLHPVTTLDGTPVTGFMPVDHPHHLGASVAIPALDGANFWGGRTYVRDTGPVGLDNHGTQRHAGWLTRTPDHLVQELCWMRRDGTELARETRTIGARPVREGVWLLSVGFALRSRTGAALTVDSPGARGRAGAGYGGFFWRAPETLAQVRAFGPDGAAHGSRGPWVALTGRRPDRPPWTLVFVAGGDPWFVRTDGYAGVCSAVAWDTTTTVPAEGILARRVTVFVADGVLSRGNVMSLVNADA
jgi:hypothetical protein